MGPRQQRTRGKRSPRAEVTERISVQGAVTCSAGSLLQQCSPVSPELAVTTPSAINILKPAVRATGDATWDVVCQDSTCHKLPQTRTTVQRTGVLQAPGTSKPFPALVHHPSPVSSPLSISHQICLSTSTAWKTFTALW